jgi:predicted RNase H-like HicB family nuclease
MRAGWPGLKGFEFAGLLPDVEVMKIKIVIHDAEEGGFWAEVPALPGCATQGETIAELMQNLQEAIAGCLAVEVLPPARGGEERMLELAP